MKKKQELGYDMDKECCSNCKHYWAGYDEEGNDIGLCHKRSKFHKGKMISPDNSHETICKKFKRWYLL